MRVLISGASGSWGLSTAKYLCAKGHEVIGLVHTPSKKDAVAKVGARAVLCNLNDPATIELARGVDAIVHTAQRPLMGSRLSSKVLDDIAREDREWTLGLLRAGAGSARCFIYASGVWAYGDTGDRLCDEQTISASVPFRIAEYKATHERLSIEEGAKLGYKSVVGIRAGTIYGHGVVTFEPLFGSARQGKRTTFVGSGEQWVSFIEKEDLGIATGIAVEKQPASCVLNVTDDEPVRLRQAVSHLATLYKAPPPRGAPRLLVKLFAGHVADALAGNTRVGSAQAKQLLGWRPVYPTYREGFTALLTAGATVPAAGLKAAG